MRHYLVVYNRATGFVEVTDFGEDARVDALAARFKRELDFANDGPDVEVVVLAADSIDALMNTHARYFSTAADLARKGSSRAWRMVSNDPVPTSFPA